MDNNKTQGDEVPSPAGAAPGVIVSPDTLRAERLPPRQSRTKKWPILDATGAPAIDLTAWRLELWGLLETPLAFTWTEFQNLPRVKVFADFHCVTRWSRLGNLWEGVSVRELAAQAGGVKDSARFVVAHAYDQSWTTNMPLAEFLAADALVATHHDGEPLTPEHGAPARLVVPSLYAWKSAKWLSGLEFIAADKAGFWERNGYHMHGDPWKEERHSW